MNSHELTNEPAGGRSARTGTVSDTAAPSRNAARVSATTSDAPRRASLTSLDRTIALDADFTHRSTRTPMKGPGALSTLLAFALLAALLPCARADDLGEGQKVAYGILIPVLVLGSGVVAGLTLGYMSLDTTSLQVLAATGTPKQKLRAQRVMLVRSNGHLLLVSLLIFNMILNETLPIIADPVLGGGVQAVVVSTVLIIVFVIPQSICTRFGLAIGAAMVRPTQIIIAITWIVSKPTSMLLERLLGKHSGVVYRRAELKELVKLHQLGGNMGGDLQMDTATIVMGTLDLQEKKSRDAMTPLADVFMLDADATRLDFGTLRKVLESGHSRIPVYELSATKQRRIIGCLLVKQLLLVDPEDATPLRSVPVHTLPFVPDSLPLLELLNAFQTGRSHMAVVAPRLRGVGRVSSALSTASGQTQAEESRKDRSLLKSLFKRDHTDKDDELAQAAEKGVAPEGEKPSGRGDTKSPRGSISSMALDRDQPLGIVTLEDLLEELIGEEILDETDKNEQGHSALQPYLPPEAIAATTPVAGASSPTPQPIPVKQSAPQLISRPTQLLSSAAAALGLPRPRSTPGRSRSLDPRNLSPPTQETLATAAPPPLVASPGPIASEPEPLHTLTEQPSNSEDGERTLNDEPAPMGGDMERRHSTDEERDATTSQPPSVRVPPALANAVLFERGRRQLASSGIDTSAISLRVATTGGNPRIGGVVTAPNTPAPQSGHHQPILAAPSANAGATTAGAPVVAPTMTTTPRVVHIASPAALPGGGARSKTFKTPVPDQLPIRGPTPSHPQAAATVAPLTLSPAPKSSANGGGDDSPKTAPT